jgi:hypothetical protein
MPGSRREAHTETEIEERSEMGKLIDRPQGQSPTESDTLVGKAGERVMPSTAPFVPETPPREEATPSQTKRPIRWMRWLAVFVVLVVGAATVAVIVTRDDGFEFDPSYAQAEQNRFDALTDFSVWNELDSSYAQAEQNRFDALTE